MRFEYDRSADAASIRLADSVPPGEAAYQAEVAYQVEVAVPGKAGEVYLDFDADGFLLGVEVLGARAVLRDEVLRQATRSGGAWGSG